MRSSGHSVWCVRWCMSDFERSLKAGLVAESAIAKWFMRRGHLVLPAYEVEANGHKGPRVFSASGSLVAPDMLVFKSGGKQVFWIEAKSKAAFTWHRNSETYQDGIDRRYWEDYLRIAQNTGWPVWLLFLHGPGAVAKDNPAGKIPPTGLFGNEILRLSRCIDHPWPGCGNGGMVYWKVADLLRLASWREVSFTETEEDET